MLSSLCWPFMSTFFVRTNEKKYVFLYAYLRTLILILRVLLLSIKRLFSHVICHSTLLTDDTEQIIIQKFVVDTL